MGHGALRGARIGATTQGAALTTAAGARQRVTRFDRRVWFQPVLVLTGVLMLAPAVIRRSSGGALVVVVVMLGVMTAASVAAQLVSRRLHGGARTAAGWIMIVLAAGGVVILTVAALSDRPEHALPFAASLAIAVSPARRTRLRLPFQAAVIAAMATLLLAAERPLLDVAVATFLFVFVVWLAGRLAQSLLTVRWEQLDARRAAERRADLLLAVADLSARNPVEAARTAVRSLRSLGSSVAGVSLERDGVLVPLALGGLPLTPDLPVGEGLAGRAVAENRVLVAEDYLRDPRRLPERGDVGAAVAVPICSDGRAVGVVVSGVDQPGALPDEVVEVAEVIARHLGGVVETEQRLARQRELLARMQALDVMRERLVTDVSEEVRDPLTVVRGISETLVTHGEHLRESQRVRLLQGFVEQAGALRTTIDALLDFSRLQAARPMPALGLSRLRDALGDTLDGVAVQGDLDVVVQTDPVLLVRCLETIRMVSEFDRIEIVDGTEVVRVRIPLTASPEEESAARSSLLLGLAERLVVTVGGDWSLGHGHAEIRLPRAPVGRATEGT